MFVVDRKLSHWSRPFQNADNPDEIDLDDDDDDDDEDDGKDGSDDNEGSGSVEEAASGIEKQAVPSKVFGSLRNEENDQDDD